MRVLLDETLCDVKVDSVAQAIEAAAKEAEKNGRMIIEVMVDGESLSGEQLQECGQNSSADEVRLISANPNELIAQTFRDAAIALRDAEQLQTNSAQQLQSGQVPEAMQQLGEAISIWMSVQQALTLGLELAEIELDELGTTMQRTDQKDRSTALNVPQLVDDLNVQLRAMQSALESRDTVALADSLLYDLPAVVQTWRDLFGDLEQHFLDRGVDT